MDTLNGIRVFVQVADTRSLVAAGRQLGLSASAIGKSLSRLEDRLGVRLFHRSTRSVTLTEEGLLFLGRSRRILEEMDAAERELSHATGAPRGRLRVSLPLVGPLVLPAISEFMHAYPDIVLDLDFTDRLVDVIEEGFDVVIRTGELTDSRLTSRTLGTFERILVGAPDYFARQGIPRTPADLAGHRCLHHRFPTTGKFEPWLLRTPSDETEPMLPTFMACNTTEALVHVARAGRGIACLPDFMVRDAIAAGELVVVLSDFTTYHGTFHLLWPSGDQPMPKLRAFIDFMAGRLFAVPEGGNAAHAAPTKKP